MPTPISKRFVLKLVPVGKMGYKDKVFDTFTNEFIDYNPHEFYYNFDETEALCRRLNNNQYIDDLIYFQNILEYANA